MNLRTPIESSKTENSKEKNAKQKDFVKSINSEENRFLFKDSNIIEDDVDIETISKNEIKALIKRMILKNKIITSEGQQQKSLQLEKNNQNQALNQLKSKEIEILHKNRKEINKKLKDLQQKQDQQMTEKEKKDKLKKKTPGNSPVSLDSKQELENFTPKWQKDQEILTESSENWQFQFNRDDIENEKKINQICVQLKNNSSSLLSIENISISSSESNFIFKNYIKIEMI